MKATRCKRGHLRTPDNLYANGTCKACMRERSRIVTEARGGKPRQPCDPDRFPCGHPRTSENTKGGHGGCKTCHREAMKRRYHEDPERYRAEASAYQKANRQAATERQARWKRDNRERYRAVYVAYLERTRERRRLIHQAWYEANREAISQYNRDYGPRWRQENPEKSRHYVRNRQDRVRRNPCFAEITFAEWMKCIYRFRGRCAYCGDGATVLHMDHVVPLSKGGRHGIGNVVPACHGCNMAKGSKFLAVWRYKHASYQRRTAS